MVSEVDPAAYRRAAGSFPSGVTVLTVRLPEGVGGMTIASFASVAMDPILVAVMVSDQSGFIPRIERAGAFAVNILAEDQSEVSVRFADDSREVITPDFPIPARNGDTGAPLIEGALAHLECRLETIHRAGDHGIVVGRVVGAEGHEGRPLAYWRGAYRRLVDAEG